MRELKTEIDIAASAETVWAILTDFPAFPEWNPFIKEAAGDLDPRAKLQVRIQPPERRAMTFKPVVQAVDRARQLRWLGKLGVRGLFDGEHRFLLEPRGEGVRFTQAERFSGVLVSMFPRLLAATEKGFLEMNAALKKRAESAS